MTFIKVGETHNIRLNFMEQTARQSLHHNEEWPKWILGLIRKVRELEDELELFKEGKIVACQPNDIESIPWKLDCNTCVALHRDHYPGFSSWVTHVSNHMKDVHGITLIGS